MAADTLYETYRELCIQRGIFPKAPAEFYAWGGSSMLTHLITILKMVPVGDDVPDIANEG